VQECIAAGFVYAVAWLRGEAAKYLAPPQCMDPLRRCMDTTRHCIVTLRWGREGRGDIPWLSGCRLPCCGDVRGLCSLPLRALSGLPEVAVAGGELRDVGQSQVLRPELLQPFVSQQEIDIYSPPAVSVGVEGHGADESVGDAILFQQVRYFVEAR